MIREVLQLGVVYDEHNKIRNHRSLVKVLLNPFLRIIGLNIGTVYHPKENRLECSKLFWTKDPPFRVRKCMGSFLRYELPIGWTIKRERMWK